jgi:hypothetical protein
MAAFFQPFGRNVMVINRTKRFIILKKYFFERRTKDLFRWDTINRRAISACGTASNSSE